MPSNSNRTDLRGQRRKQLRNGSYQTQKPFTATMPEELRTLAFVHVVEYMGVIPASSLVHESLQLETLSSAIAGNCACARPLRVWNELPETNQYDNTCRNCGV